MRLFYPPSKKLIFYILSFLLGGFFIFQPSIYHWLAKQETHAFQNELLKKDQTLKKISKSPQSPLPQGFDRMIYYKDSLKHWTTNQIPLSVKANAHHFYSPVIRLQNGWYLAQKKEQNDSLILYLHKIQTVYPFENKYLKNSFSKDYWISPKATIVLEPENAQIIHNSANEVLFYLSMDTKDSLWVSWAENLALSLLLIWLFLGAYGSLRQKLISGTWCIIIAFAARFILLGMSFPKQWLLHPLFDPVIYGSSWLVPSFGDLVLHACLFVYVIAWQKKGLINKWLQILLLAVLSILNSFLMRDLILNSTLDLSLHQIAGFGMYEYLSYSIVIGLWMCYFYILRNTDAALQKYLFLLLIFNPALLLIELIDILLIPILIFISILYVLWIKAQKSKEHSRTWLSLEIILIGVFITLFLSIASDRANHEKQNKDLQFLVGEQKNRKDLAFEYHVAQNRSSIESLLSKKLLETNPKDIDIQEIKETIRVLLLGKYQSLFDVQIHIFYHKNDTFYLPIGTSKESIQSFEDLQKIADSTLSKNLFFINDPSQELTYMYQQSVQDLNYPYQYEVFVGIQQNSIKRAVGFTDLLQSTESSLAEKYFQYSFASYKNGMLIYQAGQFIYPSYQEPWMKDTSHLHHNGYTHDIAYENPYTYISSIPRVSALAWISSASYVLFFYLILLVFGLLVFYTQEIHHNIQTLYGKVQWVIIGMFAFIILISVIGTYQYVRSGFEQRNRELLKDKLRSITLEINGKLKEKKSLDPYLDQDFLRKILEKFSLVFYSDINLFDKDGNLISSSVFNLYDQGIISQKMNPIAFNKIHIEKTSQFIHNEQIGDLKHWSGYVPIYQTSGALLCYLHLPYFLQNESLQWEWNQFLNSLLNMYSLICLVLFICIALIGQWITKPLQKIKELITNISLEENTIITYSKKDELGKLISLYNNKVEELRQKNIALGLAQKEAAWREMARQIAHEVKNPLTPMKLSVQHLSRSLSSDPVEAKKQVKKFEQTLIEHIHSLSQVASDFSDFAKIDSSEKQPIHLQEVIENAIHFFASNHPESILLEKSEEPIFILANKDQLIRVFTNILKNAVQSEKEDVSIQVEVSMRLLEHQNVLIEVKDNGKGMSESVQQKVFVPNFTTKTDGTGLGLSIVKKIIEQHQGNISFESEENIGTRFMIILPLYQEQRNL